MCASGNSVSVDLQSFFEYSQHCIDDFPIYVYDRSFGKTIVDNKFTIPKHFDETRSQINCMILGLVVLIKKGFIMGPRGSGTPLHVGELCEREVTLICRSWLYALLALFNRRKEVVGGESYNIKK